MSSGNIRTLEFEGGKPVRLIYPDLDPADNPGYTYYPTIKPANLRISNNERNNLALKLGIEHIAYNWDYFYNTVADYYQVQMAFNENNYPLSAKYTFIPSPSLSETFYYY
ncbi:MAG: hypothetical protein ABIQ27_08285 [Flavobacterium sp.]|uniref:hypothetical protein n=1 Tax=Flavobacterium sp. TaxID=239 RepID=UPI003265F785